MRAQAAGGRLGARTAVLRGVPRLSGAGAWHRWSEELDDENHGVSSPYSLVLYFRAHVTRLQSANFSYFLSHWFY